MEPVTINLPDLSAFAEQFGPFGYVIGHTVAACIFGAFAFRQISLAGRCKGASCKDRNNFPTQEQNAQAVVGDSHIWRGAITGIIGVVNAILVIVMSSNMFFKALDKADSQAVRQLEVCEQRLASAESDKLPDHVVEIVAIAGVK